ncbi:phosphatidylserine/phosphatidylglycerophosphate/cardiolipin synthase family protein [Hydrogenophaga sp.]|uniref:phospholipase D-like domain-containing protein n=1 Tax=Hydrogenophaga sp. TaxID=1904254 RepID=UPI00271F7811|nr:phospholipase D-like domain-containing protein [Hydrogenophaga sp.]MDO9438312.1 phospholipase D-like domain-containing protein [Hydrogenophaga sp.]
MAPLPHCRFQRFYALIAALWLAFALVGCKSLPRVVPDMARRTPAVQLEGTQGPLSADRSRAILERLRAGGQGSDVLSRHLAVEEAIVGTPLTAGNKAVLLEDGPATYRAMLAAIETAKDHIHLETYILDDDDIGQQFANALIAKQQQGVQVLLIHDSVGTLRTPDEFFKRLKDAGVKELEFNPINPAQARTTWELNERDHRKLLIVDGRIAFLGGINISGVYSSGSFASGSSSGPSADKSAGKNGKEADGTPWRDTHIQLQGPVVAEFQKLFLDTWQTQKGEPYAERNFYPQPERVGRDVVRAIGSSPQDTYSQIYATLLSAIGSAESTIYLTNAYFAPDPQLLTALQDAAGRGVDVKLILPSKTDSWLIFHAGRNYYTQLLKAGVKIYERQGVILHTKTGSIDGVWSTVGSTNLDWRSFLHNYEINAVVLGQEFGEQLHKLFEADLAASKQITLEEWRRRGLGMRMKEAFARAWEYWL